jgi:hypothetical protein
MTIDTEQKQRLERILSRLEHLLRYGKDDERADYVRNISKFIENGDSAGIDELRGVNFWGGMGSMMDLRLPFPGTVKIEFGDESKYTFEQTMKALLDVIHELGYRVFNDERNTNYLLDIRT